MDVSGKKPVSKCFLVLYIKHNIFVFKHRYSIRLVKGCPSRIITSTSNKTISLHSELLQVALPTCSLSKNIKTMYLALCITFSINCFVWYVYYEIFCDVKMEMLTFLTSRDVRHVVNASFTNQYHYLSLTL